MGIFAESIAVCGVRLKLVSESPPRWLHESDSRRVELRLVPESDRWEATFSGNVLKVRATGHTEAETAIRYLEMDVAWMCGS